MTDPVTTSEYIRGLCRDLETMKEANVVLRRDREQALAALEMSEQLRLEGEQEILRLRQEISERAER